MKWLLVLLSFISPQPQALPQSLMLPLRTVVICSGVQNNCVYPYIEPGDTGIIEARLSSPSTTITDTYGQVWTNDQCVQYLGNCLFSTRFSVPYPSGSDKLTFHGTTPGTVYLFVYKGQWTFDSGQSGTYNDQNSPFPDCVNGQNCPYNWTLPVDAEPGTLLIACSDTNSYGRGIASPGLGFNIEVSDGQLACEDMIAPIKTVYIGSVTWRYADASYGAASHWVNVIAAYRKQ